MRKEVLYTGIFFLGVFLAFSFVLSSFSATAQTTCCPETKEGALCEDLPLSGCSEQCKQPCKQTSCAFDSDCKKGCCISPDGSCAASSPQGKCKAGGGEWNDNQFCGIDQCARGCCVIRDSANLFTRTYCNSRAAKQGVDPEFFPEVTTDAGCRAKVASNKKGACVVPSDQGNACKLLTEQECAARFPRAIFKEGYLCTAEFLETECKPTAKTICAEGKDGVYFVDSCGNLGNIYDSQKAHDQSYWEEIIAKEESCGKGESNAGSASCGNCDAGRGSICGRYQKDGARPEYGEYSCKDLNCVEENGRERKHGESWCVYDGSIDNGTDVVGSRHWRRTCQYGKIEPQPCADYRTEACLQKDLPIEGGVFSTAACRPNTGKECYTYNIDEETGKFIGGSSKADVQEKMIEKCQENEICFIKKIDVDSGFRFNTCLPRVAPGFDYSTEEGKNKSKDICGLASKTCKITYVKKFSGFQFTWECLNNCKCENSGFVEQMSNFCASLGDCGFKRNILGDTDKAYTISGKAKGNPDPVGESSPKEDVFIESDSVAGEILRTNISILHNYGREGEVDREIVYTARVVGSIFGGGVSAYLGGVTAEWLATVVGIGDTKYKYAIFTCLPWEAPQGGTKCDICNGDLMKPCSKYRCESLGQDCKLLNEGSSRQRCEKVSIDDVIPPEITPKEDAISEGYSYNDVTSDGFKIAKEGDCIDAYTPLQFGISTNEAAQCKISTQHLDNFNDETIPYFESSIFDVKHIRTFSSPGSGVLEKGYGIILDEAGEMNFYVRCQDSNGNTNGKDYTIKVCVKEGPDQTPPSVAFYPSVQAVARFNASEGEMTFFTNEPAECRWSKEDKEYAKMEFDASCNNDPAEETLSGFYCNATIPLQENETKIFVRCKDQPFDFVEDSRRNAMESSALYSIVRSKNPLKISSLEPSGSLVNNIEPVVFDIKAIVEGGEAESTQCSYEVAWENGSKSFGGNFFSHEGNAYIQPKIYLYIGDYILRASCRDDAGNFAELNASLNVQIDRTAPIVTRAYHNLRDNTLVIITNDPGDCSYSQSIKEGCRFDFENGTRMQKGEDEREQSAPWKTRQTFFIKCRDLWGNTPGDCSIRVRTY